MLRPVHRITAAARAASEHDLSARVALTGPRDELRELADTFDDMLDRLQAAFDGQRRFIANASHELRTPLTVMRATVDVVLAKPAPTTDELRGMGQDVRAAVDHAEALVEALLTLARTDRGLTGARTVDLATIVEDVARRRPTPARPARAHVADARRRRSGDPILLERLVGQPRRQRRALQRAGRRRLAQHRAPSTAGQPAHRGQHRPGHRPGRRSTACSSRSGACSDRTADGGFGLGLAIVASIATVARRRGARPTPAPTAASPSRSPSRRPTSRPKGVSPFR